MKINSRSSEAEKKRKITRRLFLLISAKVLLIGGITSRLYSLQISEKDRYKILSDKNRIREWKTQPHYYRLLFKYFSK